MVKRQGKNWASLLLFGVWVLRCYSLIALGIFAVQGKGERAWHISRKADENVKPEVSEVDNMRSVTLFLFSLFLSPCRIGDVYTESYNSLPSSFQSPTLGVSFFSPSRDERRHCGGHRGPHWVDREWKKSSSWSLTYNICRGEYLYEFYDRNNFLFIPEFVIRMILLTKRTFHISGMLIFMRFISGRGRSDGAFSFRWGQGHIFIMLNGTICT